MPRRAKRKTESTDTPGEPKLKRSLARQDLFEASQPVSHESSESSEVAKDEEGFYMTTPVSATAQQVKLMPRVKGPAELHEYLLRCLRSQNAPLGESWTCWARQDYAHPSGTYDFVSYKFAKDGWCPVCWLKCGYGFDYKAKRELPAGNVVYGGWKCWKTGGWITCLDEAGVEGLFDLV